MARISLVRIALLSVCSLLLLACQLTLLEPEGSAAGADGASSAPSAGSATEALSALEQTLVQRSTEELAAELGVAAADVTFMEIEAVEWPDASLGCPQPDMMYAQVITDGYRIMLEANGETHTYHTDSSEDGQLVRCAEAE